jgi:tRNA pseudouridine55 synthase
MSLHGILNLDKPPGLSSAKAVGKVKWLLPRGVKIGHAGTLDPFATGVLLLLIGRATRSCERLMDAGKQYEATIKLGATTPTDDLDSPETPVAVATPPTAQQVEAALGAFVGTIIQKPPAFSALRVGGRRAYALARQGETVELQPRPVQVDRVEMLRYQWPFVDVRIDCGRGTYIRAIARDLGQALGVGGYLTALRRTRVGAFNVEQSRTLESLTADKLAAALQDEPPA